MTIKAISTHYNGNYFRSRLEARYAKFLNCLHIRYEYEPEGFLMDGVSYLPDFLLPDYDCWLEIKGTLPSHEERNKAYLLSKETQKPVIIQYGQPELQMIGSGNYCWLTTGDQCGAELFLGEAWDTWINSKISYLNYFHSKDHFESLYVFIQEKFPDEFQEHYTFDDLEHGLVIYHDSPALRKKIIALDKKYYRNTYNEEHPAYQYGRWYKNQQIGNLSTDLIVLHHKGESISKQVCEAYLAARKARFEHGTKP